MQSEPFHFTVFSTLLMATVGSIVFFSDDLFAPTAYRRRRFQARALYLLLSTRANTPAQARIVDPCSHLAELEADRRAVAAAAEPRPEAGP